MMQPRFALGALGLLALLAAPAAFAQDDPQSEIDNECTDAGGIGVVCQTADDCVGRAYATSCVEHVAGDADSRRCEVPCWQDDPGSDLPDITACAAGEYCTSSIPGGELHCKPGKLRMNLNLLDQCVRHSAVDVMG